MTNRKISELPPAEPKEADFSNFIFVDGEDGGPFKSVTVSEFLEYKLSLRLKDLEAGLTDIENKIENMERTRLRQEGAIMAMKQLLEELKENENA